ncbi:hypothetical protein HDV00_003354 [Rhizophlyctis rosea]|nr:hypothetical protein HDV00_003354 [Rhizophlyctis rosea]
MLHTTAPLALTSQYDPSLAVKIYLHEPLIASPPIAELLTTLATLEIILEKQTTVSLTPATSEREATLYHLQKDIETCSAIITPLFARIAAGRSLQEFLHTTGLNSFFPRAATLFHVPVGVGGQKNDYKSFLSKLNTYNKVANMALQIRNDLESPNHRYMAHQIALLYQGLGPLGQPYQHYQTKVQERFDEIKSTISQQANQVQAGASDVQPRLREDQTEWLHSLTTDLIQAVVFASKLVPDSVAAAAQQVKK